MTTLSVSEDCAATPWWAGLVQGIFSIIIGLLLVTNPGATMAVIVQFIGIYWLVSGVFSLAAIFVNKSMWGWKLFSGILGIMAGLAILRHPLWSTILLPTILVIILGVDGVLIGVISLISAFKGGGWTVGILGVLSLAFGFLLLGSPLISAFALPYVYGLFAIVGGFGAIIAAVKRKKETQA